MSELTNVKVGDKLAYSTHGGYGVVEVAKVGAVHITDTRGTKWAIKNGRRAGARGYHGNYVQPLTPQIARKIAIQHARNYIARDWATLTDEQAIRVAEAMGAAIATRAKKPATGEL